MFMNIPPHEIGFDFDGVVADTFRLFVSLAKENYGVLIEYDDITHYEFLKAIDIDEQIAGEIVAQLTYHPHELELKPMKGAKDVLTTLAGLSPLQLVTARPVDEPVRLWFARHVPQIREPDIRIVATKENTAKLEVLQDLEVKYFVEDRLDTCYQLAQAGITPIIFEQPWNREEHPFKVVRSWDEISALIQWNGAL